MKYRDRFKLNTKDIDLIEEALRQMNASRFIDTDQGMPSRDPKVEEVQSLLGKLHEQKIFYSQGNLTAHPRG